MFRCQCGTIVAQPEQNAVMVREKLYPFRSQVHPLPYKRADGKRFADDPGGKGYETVVELKSCKPCAEKTLAAAIKVGAIPDKYPPNHRARRAALKAPQPEESKNLFPWQIAREMELQKRYMR